jgi:hypothetical protein
MATADQRIRDLERSELFERDFPKRQHWTHAQWAVLSDKERSATHDAAIAAIHRTRDTRALQDIVAEMGKAKQADAVPVLSRLWSECALVPVRDAAGHALRAIGTPEARATLEALIEDADHLSVFLAVQAVFDTSPKLAFDRFAPYFDPRQVREPGGHAIPQQVLGTFGPAPKAGPDEMGNSHWFAADPRWIDLCVGLRRDRHLGWSARNVLRLVEPETVKAKLSEARQREGPRIVHSRAAASGDLLTRYRAGEHTEVWNELRVHKAIAGDCRAEALAVAKETMTRVARCTDLLAERLALRGWTALWGHLHHPPSAEDSAIIHDIEQFTGAPLPASLRAFWDTVGGIDFVWNYKNNRPAPDLGPDLAMVEMDPLYVDPPGHTKCLLTEWEERRSRVDPDLDDPCNLDLAPDRYHKANISGGSPYGIELPYLGADPIFMHEEHGLPFVDYLRLAFRWGGFPRLERHQDDIDVRKFVADMTKDMEPF